MRKRLISTASWNSRVKDRPECGAKTRLGGSCRVRVERGRSRCRLHGGLSTGPKTVGGRAPHSRSSTAPLAGISGSAVLGRDLAVAAESGLSAEGHARVRCAVSSMARVENVSSRAMGEGAPPQAALELSADLAVVRDKPAIAGAARGRSELCRLRSSPP
jgi:hypothetical protein